VPLLDPQFSVLLAQGVLQRAGSMPEREVVSALNVCTTMSAKAKLMQGKGLTKDIDPLSEIREWFKQTTHPETIDSTTVPLTEEDTNGKEAREEACAEAEGSGPTEPDAHGEREPGS